MAPCHESLCQSSIRVNHPSQSRSRPVVVDSTSSGLNSLARAARTCPHAPCGPAGPGHEPGQRASRPRLARLVTRPVARAAGPAHSASLARSSHGMDSKGGSIAELRASVSSALKRNQRIAGPARGRRLVGALPSRESRVSPCPDPRGAPAPGSRARDAPGSSRGMAWLANPDHGTARPLAVDASTPPREKGVSGPGPPARAPGPRRAPAGAAAAVCGTRFGPCVMEASRRARGPRRPVARVRARACCARAATDLPLCFEGVQQPQETAGASHHDCCPSRRETAAQPRLMSEQPQQTAGATTPAARAGVRQQA
jgi:hypothetical protein